MGISVEELIYRVESGEIAWGEQKVPTTPKGSEREEEYEEFHKNIFSKLAQENVDFLIAQGQFLLNHQKSQDGQE